MAQVQDPEASPAASPAANSDLPSLAEAIAAWRRGSVTEANVTALADLDRAEASRFSQQWPTLSAETREVVARQMLELAELRVDLHFGRVLRMLLDDPSATIRQLAASALWEDEGADLPIRLLALAAEDPSQDVVAQAVQSLAATCDRAATGDVDESLARRLRDELLAIADDPGRAPTVRRRALEVAAVFADDARVAPLIEDFYDADEPGFRASAVYAMGRTADGRWRSRIVDEFVSDDAELRFEAARAAGELGDSEALPGLIELAGDEDPEVRQAAIGAMGRIGGRASLRALQRLAENAAESDADAIEDALLEAETTVDPLTVDR
jgi:HEAT repeat protein